MAGSSRLSSRLSPFDPVQLSHSLSLAPRLHILLSFTRSDLSVKPIDDWQLKESLKSFIKDNLSVSVFDTDLSVHKEKDFHKKRRDEPVASGGLYIWDLLGGEGARGREELTGSDESRLRKRTLLVVEKLTGVELNMGGLKLRCQARLEDMDDFNAMKMSWEAVYGPSHTDYQLQNAGERPDTLIIRGVPSRWFAEPRVSSKASVLVTHTIFSKYGAIRNLDVREGDLGKAAQGTGSNISMAFTCHVWVQFERYSSFNNAMRAFCGRSMLREGSNFKANYELSWDKDGYFTEKNIRKRKFEKEKLEEQQRRQLVLEARQTEIALRQAELARLEHEKWEVEQRQRLREEEEKRKQERDAAKAEEEIRRQEEEQRLLEEEAMRIKSIEQDAIETRRKERLEQDAVEMRRREKKLQEEQEHREREEQKIRRRTEEARQREEQKRQLEEEKLQRKLQAEEDFMRLEDRRRRLEEEMHRRTKQRQSNEEEHAKRPEEADRWRSRQDPDAEGLHNLEFERWVLQDAPSAWVSKVRRMDSDEADNDAVALLPGSKRLRSIVVDSGKVYLPAGGSHN